MSCFQTTRIILGLSALLSACASPTVVEIVQPSDSALNCSQLQSEYADAEELKKMAAAEKGSMAGNAARLILWPFYIGTPMKADEAMAAADNRKMYLATLMNQKGCRIPTAQQAASKTQGADSGQGSAAPSKTKEDKLAELKKLYDANLLSKEVYMERQKAILDAPD